MISRFGDTTFALAVSKQGIVSLAQLGRTLRAALVGGAAVVLAPAGWAGASVYNPETFTLDNGMQVIVVTNRSAPVVSHMVWYRVGAADEPPGKSGIAHFLEHLMYMGTEAVPDGEFSRLVARNGGQENAFTSWDYTGYFQNVAVDRLALVMELEADRMVNLTLTDDKVLTERDVIMEERRQRIDDNPSARLNEQIAAALYQNHPYGTPIIGWPQEMAALTRDDAIDFYRTWYAPNNAALVVSGDIDAAELRPLAERFYGVIPARPVPERVRPQEPEFATERRVILRDPEVQQTSWRRFYRAPSYASADGDQAYALQVLSEILGGGSTGRLYRALVVDQQLAVGAGTGYSANDLDQTSFAAFIAPVPDADMATVEAAYEAEITRLLRDGATDDEVRDAKRSLVTQAVYARDSVTGPARSLGASTATGRTVDEVESWPDRIAAVTADDVMAAARAVLDRNHSVTGLLLPDRPSAELNQ